MALSAGTFACSVGNGIAACVAISPSAEDFYTRLARRLVEAQRALHAAGAPIAIQDPPISNQVGAMLVLAAQNVVGALSLVAPAPASIQGLFNTQLPPAQLITIVGSHADEILHYIETTLAAHPDAFSAATRIAQAPAPIQGSPAQQVASSFFTLDRILGVGVAVATIGGLIFFARSSDRRLSGRVDRSGFFPPSEDELEEEDAENEADDPPPPGVIDVESREVEAEPAA